MTFLDDRCTDCGFDHELYARQDTITSQPIIAAILSAAVEGLDEEALDRRAEGQPDTIAETVTRVHNTAARIATALSVALLTELPHNTPDLLPGADIQGTLASTASMFDAIQKMIEAVDGEQWDAQATFEDRDNSVGWLARHALHEGVHGLSIVGRQCRREHHSGRRRVGGTSARLADPGRFVTHAHHRPCNPVRKERSMVQ